MDRSLCELPIGIFDSGVGGLSVLRTALRMLPAEHFVYYGDIDNAPYGTKTEADVCRCVDSVVSYLLKTGIKALVIACNTATCAAAAQLREKYPKLIIIGMEPALKLAHDLCPKGQILVFATPVSLSSAKYRRLYESYGERAVSMPCPGLMDFVERGEIDTPELREYLEEKFAPYLTDGHAPSAVVLGCTHHVFLKQTIRSLLPAQTLILDGNEGAVRQLMRRLKEEELLNDGIGMLTPPEQRFQLCLNTADTAAAQRQCLQLLQLPE